MIMKTIISLTGKVGNFYDERKDESGSFAWKICVDSWENSSFVKVKWEGKHFRDDRDFDFVNLPQWYSLNLWSDGIGTKVVLADTIQEYRTMASDLLAMWLDDTVRSWWLPLVFTNVFDVNSLKTNEESKAFQQLLEWLAIIAKQQEIIIISWETAWLGECVGSPNPNANLKFNRSWSVLWASHPNHKINTNNVKAWDYIVALKQDWFRSNGISKVRWAFEKKYWSDWYTTASRDEVAQALTPSIPYARAISEANWWFNNWEKKINIHGIAHLSGWSFQSKFFEPILVKNWLSATLDELYDIPEIALKCYDRDGTMDYEELFKTRPCWQGMLVMLWSLAEAENFIKIVNQFGIEGKVAWQVTNNRPWRNSTLDIHSDQLD